MWDTQVIPLVGKIADDVKMEKGQNEEEYPDALNRMIGNHLLFRIYVKSGHVNGTDNVHSVANVCDDKKIVELNLPEDFEIGESDLEGENVKSNNVDGEGALVSIEPHNESPLSKVTSEDFEASNTYNAMGKRSSLAVKDGEHSTNRLTRKCLKRT